ncbi:MAG: PfkB family carbohydrate kinase, partial [Pseudomonadota bacterium]
MTGVPFLRPDGGAHLILGRAGLDLYAEPPGASVEEAETFRAALGGSSANIAVAIAKGGGAAALVTCVSDDAVGRGCVRRLQGFGVETRFVRSVGDERRNSLAVVESRVEGFQSIIYRHHAADFAMEARDVETLPYAEASSLVLTGTVLAAEPSRSAAFDAISRAGDADLPIVFDLDYRPYSWPSADEARDVLSRAAHRAALVVGNDEEWDWMAGGDGLHLATEMAAEGDRTIIYKRGPDGSLTLTASERFDMPPTPVEALKPVGAGDAFLGTILAATTAGRPLRDAVARGSAAAA